jgi:uncharacterized protein (DUF2252 family)
MARRTLRRQDDDMPRSPNASDPEERAEQGRAARQGAPRSSHEQLDPPARDPIALLEKQCADRVPELVPIRYERMLASPFGFFRGATLIMAHDLANTPRTHFAVQCCGDAHLGNFGIFASPERHLLFDVNDFDETLPGPWEWDVKRLAASIEVAARVNGFAAGDATSCVVATVASYRRAMQTFGDQSNLDVWYARFDADQLAAQMGSTLNTRDRKDVDRTLSRARSHDQLQAFTKLTVEQDGRLQFRSDPPLLVRMADLLGSYAADNITRAVSSMLRRYPRTLSSDRRRLIEQYRVVDVARKVVGVGSVGTRCWVALLLGRDTRDPLFLQIKEAEHSVLAEYTAPSQYQHQGHRVVAGQRLMQAASDIFLGWHESDDLDGDQHHYYVRQLRDGKASIAVDMLTPVGMKLYGEVCAWTLARAHARSGDRIAIAAYLGTGDVFDQAIARFATAYAEQNQRDYEALQAAANEGRVPVGKTLTAR